MKRGFKPKLGAIPFWDLRDETSGGEVLGFAIIELMISLAILSAILMGTLSLNGISINEQFRTNLKWQVSTMRANIQDLISNSTAWGNTVNDPSNGTLSCLNNSATCISGQGGNIYVIRDLNNVSFYDWIGTDGLTVQGNKCTTFSGTTGAGNDACPVQFQISWIAQCNTPVGSLCTGSVVLPKITIQAIYNPQTLTTPLNSNQYGATFYQGATSSGCNWTNNSGDLYETCGNVGIGTTSPKGTLDVEGGTAPAGSSGANMYIVTQNGSGPNTYGGNLVILPGSGGAAGNSSGKVDIGRDPNASSWQANLEVFTEDQGGPIVNIENGKSTGPNYPTLHIANYTDPAGIGRPILALSNSFGSADTGPLPATAALNLGAIWFQSYGGIPSGTPELGASMSAYTTENWTPTQSGAALVFGTTPNGSNWPQERMRIDQSGDVGIGTSSPVFPLQINYSSAVPGNDVFLELFNPGQATAHWPATAIENYMGPANAGSPIHQFFQSRGTAGAPAPLLSGDQIGLLNFWGRTVAATYTYSLGASIYASAGEAYSATAGGTSLIFATTRAGTVSSGASPPPVSMMIDPNGNVGINTSAPTAPLTIATSGTTSDSIHVTSAATGTVGPGITLFNSQAGAGSWTIVSSGAGNCAPAGSLEFNHAATGAVPLTISRSDNVGIGDTATSPTTTLQVGGEISPSLDSTYDLGDGTLRFRDLYMTGTIRSTSDGREKSDIEPSDLGLDFVMKLRPVSYHWKKAYDKDLHYGLIAQETEKAISASKEERGEKPTDVSNIIVSYDKKVDRYSLKYTELISPVIKAIQELFRLFDNHAKEILALRADNEKLKAENTEVKKDLASLKQEDAEIKTRLERIESLLGSVTK